jgi:hypothetical protein
MPKTYEPIATQTLVFDATTVTFSSIPSTYTDLVLMAANVGSASSVVDLRMRFNSDATSLYSETDIYGNGTSALSTRSSRTYAKLTYSSGSDKPMLIANIMNYANISVFKNVLVRDDAATNATRAAALLYRSTSAITAIEISYSSGDIAAGASFTLYGIKSA